MLAIAFHNCWFPWLESHLWRLDRLGSQGWIVVGLSVLGGCCRQSNPTMFLECLLPSTRALNLYHTEPWIQETDLSASPPIFFLVDLSVKLFSQKPITILASLTVFILWSVLRECRGVLHYQHYMCMYLLAQVCILRLLENIGLTAKRKYRGTKGGIRQRFKSSSVRVWRLSHF